MRKDRGNFTFALIIVANAVKIFDFYTGLLCKFAHLNVALAATYRFSMQFFLFVYSFGVELSEITAFMANNVQ
jgi:hypothetical protein